MNQAREFIYDNVMSLVDKFPNIKASIHYEEVNNTYYVELKPLDFYLESKELKSERLKILDEFYNSAFGSVLVFIKEDSLLEIEYFEDSYVGKNYFDVNFVLKFSTKDLRLLNNEVNIQLKETMIDQKENDYALAA
nr:hypothetical protein [uncultured Pedobacter sp.]